MADVKKRRTERKVRLPLVWPRLWPYPAFFNGPSQQVVPTRHTHECLGRCFRKVWHNKIIRIRGACKNDSHFFLTLSFLVSDANDFDSDTKEEGEEEDDAYYFAFDTKEEGEEEDDANDFDFDTEEEGEEEDDANGFEFDPKEEGEEEDEDALSFCIHL